MNKNVKVKARVGLDGAAAAVVLRSWWQPSFTVGVAGVPMRAGMPMLLWARKGVGWGGSAGCTLDALGARAKGRHGPEK